MSHPTTVPTWNDNLYSTTNSLTDASGTWVQNTINPSIWTYTIKQTDASGEIFTEIFNTDASGTNYSVAIVEQLNTLAKDAYSSDVSGNPTLISHSVKTYRIYNVIDASGNLDLVSQYQLIYDASGFAPIPGTYDVSGNNLVKDPSGNVQYTFNYTYNIVNYDVSGADLDGSGAVIDPSGATLLSVGNGVSSYIPFNNFIIENGSFANFDILYTNPAILYATNVPLIYTKDASGNMYYTLTAEDPSGSFTYNMYSFVSDASGNTQSDMSGNNSYIIHRTSEGIMVTVTDLYGVVATYPTVVYSSNFVRFNLVDGVATIEGPVIIEIQTIVIDDPVADNLYSQITTLITDISGTEFQFGSLADYQPLIDEVTSYTENVKNINSTLDISGNSNIVYLEQYAANINSMATLFGQMIIQLQSTEVVNSDALLQRIKCALETIANGIKAIKGLKIAIAQQNFIQENTYITQISNYMASLFQMTTNSIVDGSGNTYNIINNPSKLFLLQESIYWFADSGVASFVDASGADLNGNDIAGGNLRYYQVYSMPSTPTPTYMSRTYYNTFALSANDAMDISNATNMLMAVNAKLNGFNASTNLSALNANLAYIPTFTTALTSAHNLLTTKLQALGFKFNTTVQVNLPTL
jgi:hypothetical protein